MSWEDDLKTWSADRAGEKPTVREADALVARGHDVRSGPPRLALAIGRSFVAAAVLFGVWTVLSAPEEEVAPAEVADGSDAGITPPAEGPEAAPEWMPEGELPIGDWQVAIAEGARVHTEYGALVVTSGSLDLWAMPRWEGEAITVKAGEWSVTGLGGRFAVKQSPFAVEVIEGTVELVGLQVWTLVAGDRFEDGQLVRAKEAIEGTVEPVVPDGPRADTRLSDLRKLVVRGDLEAAREGLAALSEAGDSSATLLLGKVEERLGNTEAAVAAYRAVVARPGDAGGQQARYLAASLLLEARPAEAEVLLREFLGTADPLAAEARLMLGRALAAQGRAEEARVELEWVMAEHPGTTPARVAREVLEGL